MINAARDQEYHDVRLIRHTYNLPWQWVGEKHIIFSQIFKRKRKRRASSDAIFFFFFLPLFHNFSKSSRIQPKSLLLIEKTCVGNKISHVGENCLIFQKKISFIKLELIFLKVVKVIIIQT